ncbi:MAG: hypothetical protein GTO18_18830 [Anaerolineales bacterium]|nr:hypothetical protein [Anaerolineales bacterium]
MKLKAGTVASTEFANSMAEAIEDALEKEWQRLWNQPLPVEGQEDRRLLFVAIAQGVIRHLKDNAKEAFDVDVDVTQVNSNLIASQGYGQIGSYYFSVDVDQKSGAANKVQSEGDGEVSILTEGVLY